MKVFCCWGSAEIKSLGAVQCEVFNWICLAADNFWYKTEKGKFNYLQRVVEIIQNGSLGVKYICVHCVAAV